MALIRNPYCWWTKSCTTKDDDYPIIYRVLRKSQVVVWDFVRWGWGVGWRLMLARSSFLQAMSFRWWQGLGASITGHHSGFFWRKFLDRRKGKEGTQNWVVVSKIFYFYPYLGKIPILTNIFQRGWNHQLEKMAAQCSGALFVVLFFCWEHWKSGGKSIGGSKWFKATRFYGGWNALNNEILGVEMLKTPRLRGKRGVRKHEPMI